MVYIISCVRGHKFFNDGHISPYVILVMLLVTGVISVNIHICCFTKILHKWCNLTRTNKALIKAQ